MSYIKSQACKLHAIKANKQLTKVNWSVTWDLSQIVMTSSGHLKVLYHYEVDAVNIRYHIVHYMHTKANLKMTFEIWRNKLYSNQLTKPEHNIINQNSTTLNIQTGQQTQPEYIVLSISTSYWEIQQYLWRKIATLTKKANIHKTALMKFFT